jgi:hypothetical protein
MPDMTQVPQDTNPLLVRETTAAGLSNDEALSILVATGAMSKETCQSFLEWKNPPADSKVLNLDPINTHRARAALFQYWIDKPGCDSVDMPPPQRFMRTCRICFRPRNRVAVCTCVGSRSRRNDPFLQVIAAKTEDRVLEGYALSSDDEEEETVSAVQQVSQDQGLKEEGEVSPGPSSLRNDIVAVNNSDPSVSSSELYEMEEGEICSEPKVFSVTRVSVKRSRDPELVDMGPESLN